MGWMPQPKKKKTKTGWMDTKTRPLYRLSTRDQPQNKGRIQTESEGLEKDIPCKWRPKESRSSSTQFSSIQSLSRVQLFATPWIAARQASLSITISRSSLKLTSIESVMPSSHLILGRSLLLLHPTPVLIIIPTFMFVPVPPFQNADSLK